MGYKNLIIKRLILCGPPLIFLQIYMTHPLFGTGNYNDPPRVVFTRFSLTDLKQDASVWQYCIFYLLFNLLFAISSISSVHFLIIKRFNFVTTKNDIICCRTDSAEIHLYRKMLELLTSCSGQFMVLTIF